LIVMPANIRQNRTARDAKRSKGKCFGENVNYISAILKGIRNTAVNAGNSPAVN